MGWYEAFKDALSVAQKADNIELIQKLIEVQKALLDFQEQNASLKDEIKQLKEQNEVQDGLEFDMNAYWIKKGNEKNGPYCSKCWDNNRKLIRLQQGAADTYYCPVCDKYI